MKKSSLAKYIGKDYDKYNCFDLVKEFYLDHFNIDLRNYYEGDAAPARTTVEALIISNKGNFIEANSPEFGDIVVIRLYGIECHVGVIIDKSRFIHSARGIGSSVEKLSRYKRLIAGYYRHRGHSDSA